ncbi:eukaryotic translation initiation factor 3 subunit 7 (eIF-3) [Actinidia rufa]|uniref:Eukaryotic translation initiation factor 3 subunit 7 (eIF-3) n=1 Tax=Actinidia rufa TaxID=165716 RepID=A0A7J0F0Z7_9ERIC|nr:eukaryotic translation initiation factor 3 subunit 7 (eIF-3) [Actinidia rufa]
MVGFDVGTVPFNSDGWGPPESSSPLLPNHPSNVPFAPFSRSDKLGRIADWTRNFNIQNRNPSNPRNASDSVFDFTGDESFGGGGADEDSSFRLVDGRPPPRPKFGPRWRFQHHHNQRSHLPQRRDEEVEAKRREAEKERARRDRLYHLNRSGGNAPRREAAAFKSSVDIQPEWNMLDQIPFSTFTKLSFSVPNPKISSSVALLSFTIGHTIASRRRIRSRSSGSRTATFSSELGTSCFFDKRDGSQLDLLSVHETSQEPLPEAKDDINSAYSLSVEAAYINQNFSQQVLIRDGNKVGFEEGNPFANEGEEVASVAYRYRRWKLDDEMYLVARCEVQSVAEVNNQRSFLTLNALNEFDPKYSGVDWRQKLETQRGAVLATELKNNANKLAKWTSQALLASADMMKLGYVSRVHPRDHFNHVILAVVGYKPRDFAAQINLNTSNMWGIVKSIVDLCMKLNEGKYVLVKDPSKPQVRIYEVPADAFENDYMEEPLPEEEQVQPPAEDAEGGEAIVATNDVEDKVIANEA